MKGKINGMSLFTGYAGIDLALSEWVNPILYCEIERYAQAVILSRMDDGSIPFAPIWNDVTTIDGRLFKGLVDIVYGGFPCQDISVAGKAAGLAGKRSGLFFEIIRICKEASPQFIFLENVPAIRTRGAIEVQEALADIGYASRWLHLSAAEVGANHKRERWFLLAFRSLGNSERINSDAGCIGVGDWEQKQWEQGVQIKPEWPSENMAHANSERLEGLRISERVQGKQFGLNCFGDAVSQKVSDSNMQRCGREAYARQEENNQRIGQDNGWPVSPTFNSDWWQAEPDVGRVANGVELRAHRIKALGNGVVPLQVRTAFKELIGMNAR